MDYFPLPSLFPYPNTDAVTHLLKKDLGVVVVLEIAITAIGFKFLIVALSDTIFCFIFASN